jgi:hypothetical protein
MNSLVPPLYEARRKFGNLVANPMNNDTGNAQPRKGVSHLSAARPEYQTQAKHCEQGK